MQRFYRTLALTKAALTIIASAANILPMSDANTHEAVPASAGAERR
eukprot:gene3778-5000_t